MQSGYAPRHCAGRASPWFESASIDPSQKSKIPIAAFFPRKLRYVPVSLVHKMLPVTSILSDPEDAIAYAGHGIRDDVVSSAAGDLRTAFEIRGKDRTPTCLRLENRQAEPLVQ